MVIDPKYLDHLVGRKDHDDVTPFCLACGYNLTGSVSARCPECGTFIDVTKWRDQTTAMKTRIRQTEDGFIWVVMGRNLALVGLAIRLVTLAVGYGGAMAAVGRFLAFMAGFCAFFLGLSAFRQRSLPAWAREQLKNKPAWHMAATAIGVGALLVITCFTGP